MSIRTVFGHIVENLALAEGGKGRGKVGFWVRKTVLQRRGGMLSYMFSLVSVGGRAGHERCIASSSILALTGLRTCKQLYHMEGTHNKSCKKSTAATTAERAPERTRRGILRHPCCSCASVSDPILQIIPLCALKLIRSEESSSFIRHLQFPGGIVQAWAAGISCHTRQQRQARVFCLIRELVRHLFRTFLFVGPLLGSRFAHVLCTAQNSFCRHIQLSQCTPSYTATDTQE